VRRRSQSHLGLASAAFRFNFVTGSRRAALVGSPLAPVCHWLRQALIATGFAILTKDLRRLPQAPVALMQTTTPIEVQPTTLVGGVASAVRGGSTAQAPTRRWAYCATAGGAIGRVCNHFLADVKGQLTLLILVICPFILLMGTASLIDPRIMWSIRAEGRNYPWPVRAIGGVLALSSVAISAVLILVVYSAKL
jgi:hypothetical protein